MHNLSVLIIVYLLQVKRTAIAVIKFMLNNLIVQY